MIIALSSHSLWARAIEHADVRELDAFIVNGFGFYFPSRFCAALNNLYSFAEPSICDCYINDFISIKIRPFHFPFVLFPHYPFLCKAKKESVREKLIVIAVPQEERILHRKIHLSILLNNPKILFNRARILFCASWIRSHPFGSHKIWSNGIFSGQLPRWYVRTAVKRTANTL